MKKTIYLLLILIIQLSSCSYVNEYLGMEDDNLAEEAIEEVIELKAGINVDLTPSSPE